MQHDTISVRTSAHNPNPSSIDWQMAAMASPALLNALCWLIWVLFLVIPTLAGTHGTAAYSATENALYAGVGLIFCLTVHIALMVGAWFRAVLVALVLFVLAYWF